MDDEFEVDFIWHTTKRSFQNIASVELLLAPARSLWDDYFTDDYTHTTMVYHLNLQDGVFSKRITLKTNIYHFLFRINYSNKFAASCAHEVTYLGNGRKLNYVNVGDILFLSHQSEKSNEHKKGNEIKIVV